MRVPLFAQVLPVYCLIVSFFLLPIWQHHMAVADAQAVAHAAQNQLSVRQSLANRQISGTPVRIVLPRLGIDLTVVEGHYVFNTNKWTVTNQTANYATNTALPNNQSNKTLIYGHWTTQVFGSTKNLQVGDLAYVYTSNSHILAYRYVSKQIIKPTDMAVFQEFKGKPGLVLMTCQGTWAQQRRLMFFELEAAK